MIIENIIFIIFDGLILFGLMYYFFKIKRAASNDKEYARKYGNAIVGGIVAGIVVIVLDRGVNRFLGNKPTLDFSSIGSFLLSSWIAILTFIFAWGLMFLLIFFVVYSGMKKK